MNLKALRAFCLIVERGSLAAASAELHLSQPAVSRLISGLEAELRLSLFARNKRNLTTTREGAEFYREAMRILHGVMGLGHIADTIRQSQASRLRVVALSRIAYTVLAEATLQHLTRYPETILTIEVHARRDMERWIATRQFDLGLGPMPVATDGVVTETICDADLVAVLPANSEFASHHELQLSDLSRLSFIGLTPDTLLHGQIEALFMASNFTPLKQITVSNTLMACALVSRGLGWTICDVFASQIMGESKVVSIPLAQRSTVGFGIIWPSDAPRGAGALAFAETVRSVIADRLLTRP